MQTDSPNPKSGNDTQVTAGSGRVARSRTPTIFIVDDDPVTTQILQGVLAGAGFHVRCAGTVAEALAGIRQTTPDLVLLDVELPDGNGFDVCRKLQAESRTAQMPVLFISSNDELSAKVKGFEAGGVDYIPKPIAGEEVLARVSTHLRLKRAFETLAELQAERIQRLAMAQETIMPLPVDLPEAKFEVSLEQVLEAGGDFYDVIRVGNRVIDYIVADASGHDLSASFWTAALKTLLGEYATAANSPVTVLRSINSALNRMLPPGVFFTAIYARLNRQSGKLVIINAGHPPAVMVSKADRKVTVIRQEGDVLGAFADVAFGATEVKLSPGDRFFLYSDGLIESNGSQEDGLKRLITACEEPAQGTLAETVHHLVSKATQDLSGQDDILLMGVEV